jgi:hypothetical protein
MPAAGKVPNGTMYVGSNGFAVAVPSDWVQQLPGGREEGYTSLDKTQQLAINNQPMAADIDAAAWAQDAVVRFGRRFSTTPATTEGTTLAGAYATLRTYHFTYQGHDWFGLLIVCASDGAATWFQWLSIAGTEGPDRALFDAIRATFIRTHAWS